MRITKLLAQNGDVGGKFTFEQHRNMGSGVLESKDGGMKRLPTKAREGGAGRC